MRFVLAGGIGFVGINLAEELRDHGEVVVVGRPSSARKRPRLTEALRRLGAKVRLLERIDSASLASIGGDVYYHVAGVLVGPVCPLRPHSNHFAFIRGRAQGLGPRPPASA